MTEQIDEFDIAKYKPTKKQEYVKHKLHQCIDPCTIGKLTLNNIGRIKQYFYPVEEREIQEWATVSVGFWPWLVISNEQQFELNALKPQAVGCIGSILKGEIADAKLAQTQLKAAQLLLSISDRPSTSVTNNNMSIRGSSDAPRMLQRKTEGQLKEDILKLQATIDVQTFED